MAKQLLVRYVVSALGLIASCLAIVRLQPADRIVGTVLLAILFLVYIFPLVILGASIEPGDSVLRIRQHRKLEIPYSDVTGCYTLYLLPFQMVLVTTNRRFPLRFLLAVEKSLTRPGIIAQEVRRHLPPRRSTGSGEGSPS